MTKKQTRSRPGQSPIAHPNGQHTAPARKRLPLDFLPATGLALLCGLLYFLAFPGVDFWPLAFITWVPLVVALQGQSEKRALWLGWVAGFTMTMVGFYWLLEMLRTFSGFATPLCAVFMAVVCAYQAGRIALMAWLYARASARNWPAAAGFLAAFATSELIFPLLFPWTFAATLHQIPVLLQTAEFGGQILVGVAIVMANLALAQPLVALIEGVRPRWRTAGLLMTGLAATAIYGWVRIPQVEAAIAAAPPVRVGVVQADMSLMGKRHDKSEGLRRHLSLTRELQREQPLDLVVWAETSVVGATDEETLRQDYPRLFTRELGVPAIFGGVLYRPVDDERKYVLFNSALAADAEGNIRGRYDKQYLLAFGEYLPLGETFPILHAWSPNSGHFTPGSSLDSVPVGGRKVGVLICYEDIIPHFVNSIMRQDEPQLLVNMTNDAWFGDSTEPWIHWALSKFRAIEQRRFLARANNSGVSGFIDPMGRAMSHSQTFEQTALAENLAWLDGTTPFRIMGNGPWWLVTGAALWMAFKRRKESDLPPVRSAE